MLSPDSASCLRASRIFSFNTKVEKGVCMQLMNSFDRYETEMFTAAAVSVRVGLSFRCIWIYEMAASR